LRKTTLLSVLGASVIVVAVVFSAIILAFNSGDEAGRVVVYAAPTLAGVVEDAARAYGPDRVDIRSLGSVLAVKLIQAGRTPDVLMSVDWELLKMINARKILDLGFFRLHFVCTGNYSVSDIGRVRVGVANPNIAPIGYRALAALYWLSVKHNLLSLDEVSNYLNITYDYDQASNRVVIDAREFHARGRFIARDDLAGVGALLEGGAVDCIFSHTPFIISRKYAERFRAFDMPAEIDFSEDPPINFTVIVESGEIDVKAFRAFAASFTSSGDELLMTMSRLDFSKYGLLMRNG